MIHPHRLLHLLILPLVLLTGCNFIGPAGSMLGRAVGVKIKAQYPGLAGKSTGIMVWCDRGIRTDWPNLRTDLAASILDRLKTIQSSDKPDELKNTTFPIRAETIVRYQEDHPEIEAMRITDVAAKFNLDRLVYIEVTDFATRSDSSQELFKGSMTGSIRVLEIADGKSKVAYEENDIKVIFPKDSPKEGLPDATDFRMFQGCIDEFTTQACYRLYAHDKEDQ